MIPNNPNNCPIIWIIGLDSESFPSLFRSPDNSVSDEIHAELTTHQPGASALCNKPKHIGRKFVLLDLSSVFDYYYRDYYYREDAVGIKGTAVQWLKS